MTETLVFLAWERSGIYDLANVPPGTVARLDGTVALTLSDRDGQGTTSGSAPFEIMGPGDVTALNPSAVVRVYPGPHTNDAETTKCVYAELAAPDLPWRYTPQVAAQRVLRPWLVLVVGRLAEGDDQGELKLLPGNKIELGPDVTGSHPLNQSAHWAHIQIGLENVLPDPGGASESTLRNLISSEGGKPVTRLISPRGLTPNALHLAAIVPAFKDDGGDQWLPNTTASEVPVYYSWQFRTGPSGDFRTLAARLRTAQATQGVGSATLVYDRVAPAATLRVRGAITQVGSGDNALPANVEADTAALTTPPNDERGRPVVSPPVYGAAWVDDPRGTPWGGQANHDPRHRGSAGLGSAAGIGLQGTIVDAIKEQAGAFLIAAQRIRQLTMGVIAASSLWNKRLPVNPMRRLQLYGPSMRRIVSHEGTVLSQVTGGVRPIPPALFSSAARRIFRKGPARTALVQPDAADAANVIPQANTCPPPPEENPAGLPHANTAATEHGLPLLDEMIVKYLESEELNDAALLELLAKLVGQASQEVRNLFEGTSFFEKLKALVEQGKPLNYGMLMELVRLLSAKKPDLDAIRNLLEQFPFGDDDRDSLDEEIKGLPTLPPRRACEPVNLLELEASLTSAIDPTRPDSWIIVRVLSTIDGLDDQPLAPVEFCTGVDLPSWRFLRDMAPDWLLPGVGQLRVDSVYPFESNPLFVDSYLLGLNTQTLAELRWRNMPLAAGCTPLKMFWGRIDPGTDTRLNDVRDVGNWLETSDLGDADHQPPGVGNKNLVVVFRSDLFRRYPQTIVSAVEAKKDGQGKPLWDDQNLPDAASHREWPIFQGSIGDDVTFFGFALTPQQAQVYWIVLEEPPSGYTFYNDHADNAPVLLEPDANDGGNYARQRLTDPTRVLIKGGEFIPE
jgi:hypothetical protein